MPTTSKGSQPLVVVVSGGGPVGLTFSLHLTMMMGTHVKIIIYEGRWFVDRQGKTRWKCEEQGKIRRDQVITLHDHVIEQMPEYIQKGLFKETNEYVWPTSRNITIRQIEDRLFDLIQPFVQNRQIDLVSEYLHEQSERLIKGDFDVLVGADGSNSFVRRYCNIQMINEGVEYACGIAYDIPDKVASADEPLHAALNCILTVSQTRYLVNSLSNHHGYLNIRLIQDEYAELQEYLQGLQSRHESLDLSNASKCTGDLIWTLIRQGLEFFKIQSKYVRRIVPIEINIRYASVVVRELCFEIDQNEQSANDLDVRRYKKALAFLVGDAAMNTHFWSGRGMNNGMKAAIALARNILRSCTPNDSIEIHTPLRYLNFIDYESFVTRLRAYEQQGRSLRFLTDPVDKYINSSYSYIHLDHSCEEYKEKLIEKLRQSRTRFEDCPEWPHRSRPVTDDELEAVSDRIVRQAVPQLTLANPWPTREMSDVEVLVEDIFPYDLTNFLPLPTLNLVKVVGTATVIVHHRFIILWIIGCEKIELIDNLVQSIQKSENFTKTSKNKNSVYEINVVQTVADAKEWIESHQELIRKSDVRFKVITVWRIKDNQSAVDAIRAVRSVSPRVPVLIFTNKHEAVQPALQFPNVLVTDMEYELKEFAEVIQETQWNPGHGISSTAALASPDEPKPRGVLPLPYPLVDNPELPVLPIPSKFNFPPLLLTPPPTRGTPNPTTPKVPKLKPMLLWIDSADHDQKATEEIRKNHSTLEINFVSTFHDAETYLNTNLHEIGERKKFIVICRSYYPPESKSFTDVAQLFQKSTPGIVPLAVYTRSRTSVLERTPNPPQGVEIFDTRKDLLAFIERHLNETVVF